MAELDVIVIGGGPGGYVAALRAAQLGKSTVLFEREAVGGLCLNWGCIPSKAMLRNADVVNLVRDAERWGIRVASPSYDLGAAVDRSRQVVERLVSGVEGLLKSAGVRVVQGEARFTGPKTVVCNGDIYEAANIIVATGASTRMLPGVEADGKVVITSREALVLRKPPKRAVIIGGGPVGAEFAHIWAAYGSEVTVVEMLDTLLPLEDPDLGRQLRRSFEARGIAVRTGAKVESVETKARSAAVTVTGAAGKEELKADVVLVAIGFVPHTRSLDLDRAGIHTERGFIAIDDHMQTNVPGVYAIGDVTGKLMLAHVASAQGVVAAEHLAGLDPPPLDYVQMPRATYCQPQVASIGYTEEAATRAGFTVKTGRFPFTALGKAIAVGEDEGFIKVVADEATGQVLGIHMIGHDVNELLGEATLIALLEATTREVGFAVHAHPTLTEALKEAALAVDGEAIHISQRRTGASKGGTPR